MGSWPAFDRLSTLGGWDDDQPGLELRWVVLETLVIERRVGGGSGKEEGRASWLADEVWLGDLAGGG